MVAGNIIIVSLASSPLFTAVFTLHSGNLSFNWTRTTQCLFTVVLVTEL